jgi:hypothetical protein
MDEIGKNCGVAAIPEKFIRTAEHKNAKAAF